jgi:hypothetical protein
MLKVMAFVFKIHFYDKALVRSHRLFANCAMM